MVMHFSASSNGRLYYLDALRAFCMLFGVLSHGATIGQHGEAVFEFLKQTSDLFRMSAFFAVAGFFTAMVYRRKGAAGYVAGRVRLILVPLAAGLVLIAPVTNYLIHTWHNGPMSLQHYFLQGGWAEASLGRDVWHLHLWFLFSLFAFAMLTPTLVRLLRHRRFGIFLDHAIAELGRGALWVTALSLGIAMMALRGAQDHLVADLLDGNRMTWIVAASLTYLPFYALGVLMFVHANVFRMMHRIDIPGLMLFAFGFWAFDQASDMLPQVIDRVGYWMCKGGVIVFAIAALIGFFERYFDKPSPLLTSLVDGAFSFYLLHLTVIYLVAHALAPITGTSYATFLVLIPVVPILTLGAHRTFIAPFVVMRVLFNGKPMPRAASIAAAVAA
jgi:glucans biosynthesis protein C